MTLRAITGLMNQPTAQVIDGSLKFDGNNQYLSRSFGSGNRKNGHGHVGQKDPSSL